MKFTYRSALRVLLLCSLIFPVFPTPLNSQGVAAADNRITMRYDFAAPRIVRAGEYHSVTTEGLPNLEQAGLPRLPIKAARILIPFGQEVSGIEVIRDGKRIELDARSGL